MTAPADRSIRSVLSTMSHHSNNCRGGCGDWGVSLPDDAVPPRLEAHDSPGGRDALCLTVHATETIEVAERGHHPVVPGLAYCLTAHVRTALGNAHGRMFLQWRDAAGKVLGDDASKYTFLVHDYAPLQVWAIAPDGAAAARCLLRLTPPAPKLFPPSGSLWLAPSTFAPSMLLDATPAANAALFDAGQPAIYSLAVRGAPATLRQATVRYALVDLDGKAAADGSITISLCQGEGRATLSLPALPTGYYELSLVAEGDGLAPFELRRSLGCLPAEAASRRPDTPIALDAGLAWPADNNFRPERTASQAAACARIGISLLRERLAWHQVNPKPARFDWGKYRQSADIQRAHGLDVYAVFHDTPAWARAALDGDHGNVPPADPRHVYEFTRRLALDLGGAIRHFELWNEPDIFFFAGHPWDVAAIIKAGCLGLKDGDPSIGVLASSRAIGPEFWRCLLANGIGPYFEIWNQHCYGQPEALFDLMRENRELLEEAGLGRPVWLQAVTRPGMPLNQEFQQQHKLALPVEAGQVERLELRVHNWSGRDQSGELAVDLPDGWSCDTAKPISVNVAANSCATVHLDLVPVVSAGPSSLAATPVTVSVRATLCIDDRVHDVARVDYSAATNSKTGYTKE